MPLDADTSKRIVLIGPANPYRGGIAHHTNMFARKLRERGHDVDVVTFRRQYPKRLYPGQFQEESDPSFSDVDARRLLDSFNPFNWVRVARQLRNARYDLYVLRFWIPLFGPMFGTIGRILGGGKKNRAGRSTVITVIDNLFPHEKRPGDTLFRNWQFRYTDKAVTQSGTVSHQFRSAYPAIPETMIPHPTYENFGDAIEQKRARRMLGLDDRPTLLFFGFIRKYKGLDVLLQAMPAIRKLVPDVRLLVVGEFFGDATPYLEVVRQHDLADSVEFHSEYVPNDDVAAWFSAADLLVMPYRSATNSGIVQIAYNFTLPSVVTDVGSLSEVVSDGETGFVLSDSSPDSIAAAVRDGLDPEILKRMRQNISDASDRFSWSTFASRFEEFAFDD